MNSATFIIPNLYIEAEQRRASFVFAIHRPQPCAEMANVFMTAHTRAQIAVVTTAEFTQR